MSEKGNIVFISKFPMLIIIFILFFPIYIIILTIQLFWLNVPIIEIGITIFISFLIGIPIFYYFIKYMNDQRIIIYDNGIESILFSNTDLKKKKIPTFLPFNKIKKVFYKNTFTDNSINFVDSENRKYILNCVRFKDLISIFKEKIGNKWQD